VVTAYIGDLSDPKFSWDNGDWNGNRPKKISPEFPDSGIVLDKIWKKFKGKQVDWGTYVVKVNKEQITQFVSEIYELPYYLSFMNEAIKELIDFIANLENDKIYALVACEIY
jgi:hypothetical protein